MSTKTRVRSRPATVFAAASTCRPVPSTCPSPLSEGKTPASGPVKQTEELQVDRGDRWTFLFWLGGFGILVGLLVLEVMTKLVSWLLA